MGLRMGEKYAFKMFHSFKIFLETKFSLEQKKYKFVMLLDFNLYLINLYPKSTINF